MPEPEPEKVQVVPVQETPEPENVNAPAVELIEETPLLAHDVIQEALMQKP